MARAVLIDSNILIDHFSGVQQATTEIDYHDDAAISAITWSEIMVRFYATRSAGMITQAEFDVSKDFLESFEIIEADRAVLDEASKLRARSIVDGVKKLPIPDAIIRATGNVTGRMIISRNTNDFPASSTVRVPYTLTSDPATVKVLTPVKEVIYTVSNIAPYP